MKIIGPFRSNWIQSQPLLIGIKDRYLLAGDNTDLGTFLISFQVQALLFM